MAFSCSRIIELLHADQKRIIQEVLDTRIIQEPIIYFLSLVLFLPYKIVIGTNKQKNIATKEN